MATKQWRGDAPQSPQFVTLTVGGTIAINDTFSVTINGKVLTYTATTTTVADVATGVATAWQTLDIIAYPEFAEITATAVSTTVQLVAQTPGKPFTVSLSHVSTGGTWTQSTTKANSGPKDISVAGNWLPSGTPGNGDDVYIDGDVDLLYGLDALSAVTLNSLNIAASFTGTIGLPFINNDSVAAPYAEYRVQYLEVGATTSNIGTGDGNGSGRVKIDFGSVATTCNIYATGRSLDSGLSSVQIKGTSGSNVVNVFGGTSDIAMQPGNSATVSQLNVVPTSNSATARCGSGVTLTTLNLAAGTAELHAGATTVNQTAGTLNVYGSGTVTTVNLDGGTLVYQSSGTITTLNVGNGATADFTKNIASRTITNANLFQGAVLTDTLKTVTFTNGIILNRCKIADVKVDVGDNRTITPS